MKKLMFIYNNPMNGAYGGSQRTKQAFDGLNMYFDVVPYSCIKKPNKIGTYLRNVFGYSGNMDIKDCHNIFKKIIKEKIEVVYFDVSLHGKLVRKIKRRFPKTKIIVNYHNNEKKFYYDGYKQHGIHYFPIYRSAWLNEKLSSKFADLNIFISNEDKVSVNPCNSSLVIPATLKDYFVDSVKSDDNEPYLLFIGSSMAPNVEAANIIINQISPNINVRCVIAGSGMDKIFTSYDKNKIEVKGFVSDFAELLIGASAFISPLYHGSGSKIKVAEALMFGKKILGTKDSFFGYDFDGLDYVVCKEPKDFIDEINKLDLNHKFYVNNRDRFLEMYSDINLSKYYEKVYNFFYKEGGM